MVNGTKDAAWHNHHGSVRQHWQQDLHGLLEPRAATSGMRGSEEAAAQQCAAATRLSLGLCVDVGSYAAQMLDICVTTV